MKHPFGYRMWHYLKYGRFPQPFTLKSLFAIQMMGRAGGLA